MTQEQLRELVCALLYSLSMCDHMGDVSNVVDDLLQVVEPFGVTMPEDYNTAIDLEAIRPFLPEGTFGLVALRRRWEAQP